MARKKATVDETLETTVAPEEKPARKPRTRKAKAAEAAETTETTEAAPKKRAARTPKKEAEVYVQWWGKEVSVQEVVERVKLIWTEDMGKKASEMKELQVYIKPEENLAHYVINKDIIGSIVI